MRLHVIFILLFSDLIFSRIPEDDDDASGDGIDEFDAVNDETSGAILGGTVDAELEHYAAQTARLRLDDPVWNPSSAANAPDASQVPMPDICFDTSRSAHLSVLDEESSGNGIQSESRHSTPYSSEDRFDENVEDEDEEILHTMKALRERWAKQEEDRKLGCHSGAEQRQNNTQPASVPERIGLVVKHMKVDDRAPVNPPGSTETHQEHGQQLEPNNQLHPLARHFPDCFTWDMVDFITNPENRGGEPWDERRIPADARQNVDHEIPSTSSQAPPAISGETSRRDVEDVLPSDPTPRVPTVSTNELFAPEPPNPQRPALPPGVRLPMHMRDPFGSDSDEVDVEDDDEEDEDEDEEFLEEDDDNDDEAEDEGFGAAIID